jgi:hypothetical protein
MLLSSFASIRSPTTVQTVYTAVFESAPLAPKGASSDSSPLSVGEPMFLSAQLLKKTFALRFGNLSQKHGAQQRAPEDGPVSIVTTHSL